MTQTGESGPQLRVQCFQKWQDQRDSILIRGSMLRANRSNIKIATICSPFYVDRAILKPVP